MYNRRKRTKTKNLIYWKGRAGGERRKKRRKEKKNSDMRE